MREMTPSVVKVMSGPSIRNSVSISEGDISFKTSNILKASIKDQNLFEINIQYKSNQSIGLFNSIIQYQII